MIGRCGALLPLFRLVGVLCIAALWRVESLPRHRGDRPKLNSTAPDYLRSRGVASGVKPDFEAHQGSRCRWPDAEAKRPGYRRARLLIALPVLGLVVRCCLCWYCILP